jgi:hypothetical protein
VGTVALPKKVVYGWVQWELSCNPAVHTMAAWVALLGDKGTHPSHWWAWGAQCRWAHPGMGLLSC